MTDKELIRILRASLEWQVGHIGADPTAKALTVYTLTPIEMKQVELVSAQSEGLTVRGVDLKLHTTEISGITDVVVTVTDPSERHLAIVTLPFRPLYDSDYRLNVAVDRISRLLWNGELSGRSLRVLVLCHRRELLEAFYEHAETHELVHELGSVKFWSESDDSDVVIHSDGYDQVVEGKILSMRGLAGLEGSGTTQPVYIGVIELSAVGH